MAKLPRWQDLRTDGGIARLVEVQARVQDLLRDSGLSIPHSEVLADPDWARRIANRVSSRLSMMVIGQVSAGKSSFVNALLGRRLLAPSSRPTDGVVSVLLPTKPGAEPHAEKVLIDGTVQPFVSIDAALAFLRQQETPREAQLECREVRLYLDEPWLEHLRVVNTPGLGDRLEAFEAATLRYLREDESDLVMWIFFPDTAGNKDELGTFAAALERRRGTVVGVVTRTLEGDKPESYDPADDVSLQAVTDHLRAHLGAYLSEVILFDSHEARRLVEQLRADPKLKEDPRFQQRLGRCGYLRMRALLEERLGPGGAHVEATRVRSVLQRCAATATALTQASTEARAALEQRAGFRDAEAKAWNKFEKDVLEPVRGRLKADLRKFANERATILVGIMGRAAAAAVRDEFGLVQSLWRSALSWTGWCDSATDRLNAAIDERIQKELRETEFEEQLRSAGQLLVREHLERLESELRSASEDRVGAAGTNFATGVSASGTDGAVATALSAALKPVISAVLKQLAKVLEKQATGQAVKTAAKAAAREAAEGAAGAAAAGAARSAAGATAARVAGVVTLVLIPFDIAKLVKDFDRSRENLGKRLEAEYAASRNVNEVAIFDAWWRVAFDAITTLKTEARKSVEADADHAKLAGWIEEAGSLAAESAALGADFSERAQP
jgi:hypothetical protein